MLGIYISHIENTGIFTCSIYEDKERILQNRYRYIFSLMEAEWWKLNMQTKAASKSFNFLEDWILKLNLWFFVTLNIYSTPLGALCCYCFYQAIRPSRHKQMNYICPWLGQPWGKWVKPSSVWYVTFFNVWARHFVQDFKEHFKFHKISCT